MKLITVVMSLAIMAGCTPIQTSILPATEINNRSEVVIYRESAATASLVNMIFGSNGNDYVKLQNGKYASVFLTPGSYEFFVRSDQADRPYPLTLELAANEVTCLHASVNGSAAAVAILGGPLGYLASRGSSTFKMEKAKCLSAEELGDREIVKVVYAD